MKTKHISSCGQCRFLTRHKKFNLPCENLGKISTSKQCSQFEPDVFALAENVQSLDRLRQVASIASEMPTSQVQVLAEILFREYKTRKAGHYLGEELYLQYRGNASDLYFSNFIRGYVLKATKKELLLVDEGARHYWVMDYERGERYFTEKDFAPIREIMLSRKAFIDPEIKKARFREQLMAPKVGQVMSIEDAEVIVKKKKKRPDLVDLATKLTRGHIAKKKSSNEIDDMEELEIKHN